MSKCVRDERVKLGLATLDIVESFKYVVEYKNKFTPSFCSLLYFSTSSVFPVISQAHMDGRNVKTLFEGDFFTEPTGLTLDKPNKRLYWVDTMTDQLQYLDLATMQDTVVRDDLESPVGLALYRGYLYWTSRGSGGWTGGVYRSAPTMNSIVTKVVGLLRHPTGIYAQDSQKNEGDCNCSWMKYLLQFS